MSDIELERFKAMLRDESIDDLLTALAYKIPLYRLDPLIIRGRTEHITGNDSNLLIVFYVQIMPDDFVMQLHRF